MTPRARIAIIVFVSVMGCIRATASTPAREQVPVFRFGVIMDEAIAGGTAGVLRADGGVLYVAHVGHGEGLFAPRDWYRGAGHYALSLQ